MSFVLSQEQTHIIDTILQVPPIPHIQISSVAGSSKSTTIHKAVMALLQQNPKTKIQLLMFGRQNAEEARQLLPSNVGVSTIHALAYKHTIKPLKLKIPIRDRVRDSDVNMVLKISSKRIHKVIELVDKFTNSDYTNVDAYVKDKGKGDDYTSQDIVDCKAVLYKMEKGKINVTHSFYLKLFHAKVLNGTMKIPPVDVLILEEAQDLTQVMVDVTDKYITKQRIFIGDSYQQVLGFTGSVDVLSLYKDKGLNLNLTKSFRVNVEDAKVVQYFMQIEVEPSFKFEGFDRPYPENPTFAYLTRTNAALIAKMILLDRDGTPFKLSTKTKLRQLFTLPLTLASLKAGGIQKNEEMQYLQDECDRYYNSGNIQKSYKTLFSYFKDKYAESPAIIQGMDLVLAFGASALFTVYASAKEHMKSDSNLTLSTASSSKGGTFTEVELDPSMDKALQKVLPIPFEDRSKEDLQEIYLFYVATTRSTHVLKGSLIFNEYKYSLQRLKEK